MRIDNPVGASQSHSLLPERPVPPSTMVQPHKVEAIGQTAGSQGSIAVSSSPPDDSVTLDLSPEGREAARRAAMQEMVDRVTSNTTDDGEESPQDGKASEQASTDWEAQQLEQLKEQDKAVRARELVMAAAGGGVVRGSDYTYRMGPDGHLYAVEGQVNLDTTEVPDDPEATLRKAEQLQRAALAGDPTEADRATAAKAAAMAARARADLQRHEREDPGNAETGSQVRVEA